MLLMDELSVPLNDSALPESPKDIKGRSWWKMCCGGCCLVVVISVIAGVAAASWYTAGRPVPSFLREFLRGKMKF